MGGFSLVFIKGRLHTTRYADNDNHRATTVPPPGGDGSASCFDFRFSAQQFMGQPRFSLRQYPIDGFPLHSTRRRSGSALNQQRTERCEISS